MLKIKPTLLIFFTIIFLNNVNWAQISYSPEFIEKENKSNDKFKNFCDCMKFALQEIDVIIKLPVDQLEKAFESFEQKMNSYSECEKYSKEMESKYSSLEEYAENENCEEVLLFEQKMLELMNRGMELMEGEGE